MLSYAVKRLVQGGQPLLAIQYKISCLMPIQYRRSLELPAGKQGVGVSDSQQAARRIVRGDGHDQLLRGAGFPHEVSLEVRQCRFPRMDLRQQLF